MAMASVPNSATALLCRELVAPKKASLRRAETRQAGLHCGDPLRRPAATAPPLPAARRHRGLTVRMASGGVIKLLGISGSLRKASFNTGLVRAAAEVCKEIGGVEMQIADWRDVPVYNGDVEAAEGFPPPVAAWRAQIEAADGLLFACPEYNYSVAGPLKNAIDWASRPPNAFARKGAAIAGAAGFQGGSRANYHLRQIGIYLDIFFLTKPDVFVNAFAPGTFDKEGNLVSDFTRDLVRAQMVALKDHVLRLEKYNAA